MNVNTLIEQVYYRIGRYDAFNQETHHTEILNALNTVQRSINNELNLDELRVTTTLAAVDGTRSYNLASDFLKMDTIWSDGEYSHELRRIYPNEYKNYGSDIDTTEGTLYYYDIFDESSNVKQIYFIPIPGTTDTIPYQYYKKIADLSAGGGANILTTYYPDLFIEGASYFMYRDLIYRDQPEKIAFRKAEYKEQVEKVKRAQRKIEKINNVAPKRIIRSGLNNLYTTQFSGYTS